ncbi:hypothetical protein Saa2_00783 [Streptomyces acidiscabies]|nr:hypothetical protein Saa2_00783 [Streptomyces acidiscabies]
MPSNPGQRTKRQIHNPVPMIVLDHDNLGILPQHPAQFPSPPGTQSGPRRILRPIGDDNSAHPEFQSGPHPLDNRPFIINGNRKNPKPERPHKIKHPIPPRILDGDRIPGLQMNPQHPLDRVQRP